MDIIALIIVGIVAGWLAGLVWKGSGFGILGDMAIGIAGSFIGRAIFRLIGISFHGFIGSTIAAAAGALLLLFIISKLKR